MSRINLKIEEYHLIQDEIKQKKLKLSQIEAELDRYLEAKGVKKITTPGGYTYSVSEVGPTYGVDNTLWEYLKDAGIEHEEVCVGTIDREKLVPLLQSGRVDQMIVFNHIREIRKGYKRHSYGKEKE